MGKNAIAIKELAVFYGRKRVINNINWKIPRGKIVGLLGPSGCGKTTLVKVITGIHAEYKGEVSVMGEPVPSKKLLRELGYMAQKTAIYENISGYHNLEFFGQLYSLGKERLNNKIQELASLVNLQGHLSKKVCDYSAGMKQRLALAVALIGSPKMLILDEPTVGIDPLLKVEIWEELTRLSREEHITILITTHVMDEAARCDLVAIMRRGEILSSGSPEEIQRRLKVQNLEEAFIKLVGGSNDNSSLS